jgi:hypothetical protein
MLKKVEAKCKRCGKEFCRKRTEQEFCSAQCRNAAWKKPRKRRLKGTPRGSVANGPFSSIKTEACKPPSTPDLGAFVRAQIVAQEDEPNPIGFTLTVPRAASGSPATTKDQRSSAMTVIGGSTQRNFFVRGSEAPKQSPGCHRPRRYAGPLLSLVAMTQFETLMMLFNR